MKNIYFACSIRGGRDNANIYPQIVEHIKTKANVLTEIFADQKLTSSGMNKPNDEIWSIDTAWIKMADAVIAEVTNPSLGVGYEIAYAESLGKSILALFNTSSGRRLSAMIDGCPNVTVAEYTNLDEALVAIDSFLKN